MTVSRTKLLDSLRHLQRVRRRLLRRLTQDHELAVGSVSLVRRKCGNPSCHCAHGPGHLQTIFLFQDNKRRCKLIRRADEARLHQAGKHYRKFKEDIKQLRAIDRGEMEILMALRNLRAIHYK